MRLEEYWGIGPKTSELLAEALGVEAAIAAIESADIRTLTDAGLSRGRATRILRRVEGGPAMDRLATRDTREVYKQLLDIIGAFAVTDHAADRIRVLTPLESTEEMRDRLATVEDARAAWAAFDEDTRAAVVAAFEDATGYDDDRRAAVEAALALQEAGVADGVFEPVTEFDREALEAAAAALAGLSGEGDRVGRGADDTLDTLRDDLGAVEDMAATPADVVEAVQTGARSPDEFRRAFVDHVTSETGVDVGRVREATAGQATDAHDFVTESLRALASGLREAVDEREQAVAADLEGAIADAAEDIERAVSVVDDLALYVSLARFAAAYDLRPADIVAEGETLAVAGARNLELAAAGVDVQPITYAVGDHDLAVASADDPPAGHRVAVLTGANSGGKTTLLETLCQIQLLTMMGLPVPAERAQVSPVDAVVFHRRHDSFNAGVLESTLRNVVPPLSESGRTLMLVDEFEAITEPGSAADLLHGLVTLTVEQDALGVFVTHLADDLQPLPDTARIDGIFAEGLTTDLELQVDYQPRFGTLGKSTPEFIVSRLVADAEDHTERAGFQTLATAVGEAAVQRTLSDAEWTD